MIGTWLHPFRISGHIVTVRTDKGGIRLAGPADLCSLIHVVNTAFTTNREWMLGFLIRGKGQRFVDAAYTYAAEAPSEIPYGCIRCTCHDDKILVRENEFTLAALALAKVGTEDDPQLRDSFDRTHRNLRWRAGINLPRAIGYPFEARFGIDIVDPHDGIRVARALTDGETGRIDLFAPDREDCLLDILCRPVSVDIPAFSEAAFVHLANVGLAAHGLAGTPTAVDDLP